MNQILSCFANTAGNSCSLRVRAAFCSSRAAGDNNVQPSGMPPGLENQRRLRVIGGLCSEMFHTSSPLSAEKVEPQAILVGVGLCYEPSPKCHPLSRIYDAFKYGILHPLTMTFADLGDASQPPPPSLVTGTYVITYKDHHGCSSFRSFLPTSRKRRDRHPDHREYSEPVTGPAHKAPAQAGFVPSGMGALFHPASLSARRSLPSSA